MPTFCGFVRVRQAVRQGSQKTGDTLSLNQAFHLGAGPAVIRLNLQEFGLGFLFFTMTPRINFNCTSFSDSCCCRRFMRLVGFLKEFLQNHGRGRFSAQQHPVTSSEWIRTHLLARKSWNRHFDAFVWQSC